jgi:hypothetical protein
MSTRYKVGDLVTHLAGGKKIWKIESIHHNYYGIKTVYIIVPDGKNPKGMFTVARASNMKKVKK